MYLCHYEFQSCVAASCPELNCLGNAVLLVLICKLGLDIILELKCLGDDVLMPLLATQIVLLCNHAATYV